MPDKRHHRGAHPQDHLLFAPKLWPRLRDAVSDYSWLLNRGYASKSALALVGNRYQLAERQRLAVMRCACSDSSLERRRHHEVSSEDLAGQTVLIDGYNLLITVEAALAGGVILLGRDGCYRDLASLHGTIRRVEETVPAIKLIGDTLVALGVLQSIWYLDSPVSNSGRLKGLLLQIGAEYGWDWQVEVVINPDPVLLAAGEIIATADSVILDGCARWFNLGRFVVEQAVPEVWMITLDTPL